MLLVLPCNLYIYFYYKKGKQNTTIPLRIIKHHLRKLLYIQPFILNVFLEPLLCGVKCLNTNYKDQNDLYVFCLDQSSTIN